MRGLRRRAVGPDACLCEVAKILCEQGATRDARIQDIADALDRRAGNADLAAWLSPGTALAAAIAANAGLHARSGTRSNDDGDGGQADFQQQVVGDEFMIRPTATPQPMAKATTSSGPRLNAGSYWFIGRTVRATMVNKG